MTFKKPNDASNYLYFVCANCTIKYPISLKGNCSLFYNKQFYSFCENIWYLWKDKYYRWDRFRDYRSAM